MVNRAVSPIQKTLLALTAAVALLFAACTALVTPDRRKIHDDLYHPTDGGVGGAGGTGDEDAGQDDAAADAGDAGNGDGAAGDAAADGSPLDAIGDLPGSG